MSSIDSAPSTSVAATTLQTPQGDPLNVRRLYDRISTTWLTAGGVLIAALTIGALRTGKLGSAPFSWQICATAIVVSLSPSLSRHLVWAKLKNWQLVIFWATWMILCALPVFVALVIELFTGHRRPGSRWYDGVWRIYVILGLWMIIAVAMERYVKPFWRAHSERFLGRVQNRSVNARGHDMAMQRRAAKLESIKKKVSILLRRKKRLQSLIDHKIAEITQLQNSEKSTADDGTSAERLRAIIHEKDAAKQELDDVEDQLQLAQIHWTEALNVDNYHSFYR